MAICTVSPEERQEFLAFCNAGMRPGGARTRLEDDFPVIFSPQNRNGLFGIRDQQGWAAAISVLVRTFTTTAGEVSVAGVGSVVTRPDRRGEGLSNNLQTIVLGRLAGAGAALAVLWTDRQEIYAGRGFTPAGWEYHLDLTGAAISDPDLGEYQIRPFEPRDLSAIAMLYDRHPLRTRRQAGDEVLLYGMPGTQGLVLDRGRDVAAYAFCGKGADFPSYVAEWGGPPREALAVVAEARRRGLAHRVLVPACCDEFLELALQRGAACDLRPSGLWKVLRPELLSRVAGQDLLADMQDPRVWLGYPGRNGRPVAGRLAIAVWGFDSV